MTGNAISSRSPELVRRYKEKKASRAAQNGDGSTAARGTITVSFAGIIAEIEFSNEIAELQRRCSEVFGGGVHPAEVVGFDNGKVLYPASYVANAEASLFEGQTLCLILSRHPAPAVPAATEKGNTIASSGITFDSAGIASMVFVLGNEREVIRFSHSDLQKLVYLRTRTRLNLVKCNEIISLFTSQSTLATSKKRVLDKATFDHCIRCLVPGGDLNADEKQYLSLTLNKIFFAFDRDQEGVIDLCQFLAGFLCLAGGDRTEKMRTSFLLFEDPMSGKVSTPFLVEYVRSFLIVVMAMCDATSTLPTDYLIHLIDESAELAVHKCLQYVGSHASGKLGFDGFLVWYEGPGKNCLPWFDLLAEGYDIALVQMGGAGGNHTDKDVFNPHDDASGSFSDEEEEDDEFDDDDDDMVVFEFQLPLGQSLCYKKVDMENLQLILETTRLDTIPAARVHETMKEHSDQTRGVLTKDGFDAVIRALIPGDRLSREEQGFLSFVLSNLFARFARGESGEAPVDEISSGFAILAKGSKSEKLSLGFEQFQERNGTEDVIVDPIDLSRYLRSFLTVLMTLNESAESLPETDMNRLIDVTAVHAARHMLQFHKRGGNFTFKDFGTWYNDGSGQEVVPWLELLDLRKWPMMDASSTDVTRGASTAEDGLSTVIDEEGNFTDDFAESEVMEPDQVGERSRERAATSRSSVDISYGSPFYTSHHQNQQVVFQFQLTEDGDVLEIRLQDVEHLEQILVGSKLNTLHPQELVDYISKGSVGGHVSKHSFDRCMHEIIRSNNLKPEVESELKQSLSSIFFAYDRDAIGTVQLNSLACGMCFLTNAKKSDKLALGFRMFDTTGQGKLSKDQLVLFLGSFLTVLFAINQDSKSKTARSIWSTVDACANEFASKVLQELDMVPDSRISFEDFATWYTNGGYELVPWVELLDLNKWPTSIEMTSPGESVLATRFDGSATAKSQHDNEVAKSVGNHEIPVFRFPLTEAGDWLELYQRDVSRLSHALSSTRLDQVPAGNVFAVFIAAADKDGVIAKEDFDNCSRQLVNLDELTPEDIAYVSFLLSNVFYAFDRETSDQVNLSEFASGFCLLSKGSKSEKLNLSFDLFDGDQDGKLTRKQLWLFVRSFLTVLLALNEDAANGPADVIWRLVDESAVELAAKILLESKREDRDLISFEEFATWYTEGGFDLMPWLELLDLRKWVVPSSAEEEGEKSSESIDAATGNRGREEANELENSSNIVFHFVLTAEGKYLDIRPRDVANLHMIVQTAGFDQFTAEDIHDVFGAVSEDGILAKDSFLQCIRDLVPGLGLSQDEKTYLSHALSNLFYAYDRDGDGVVALNEFASGFSILATGTKSDKLQLAFHLFDTDEDGVNSFGELVGFMRAFLTVLFALNEEASRLPAEEVWRVVDQSTEEYSNLIYRDLDLDVATGKLSFEEFAAWYTDGGFNVVPWLELLNVQKWPDYRTTNDVEQGGKHSSDESNGEEETNKDTKRAATESRDTGSTVSDKENMSSGGIAAFVTTSELDLLGSLAGVSSAETLEFPQLIDKLRAAMDANEMNLVCFDRFLNNLADMTHWSEEDVESYKGCFVSIFQAYDRTGDGVVSFEDIATGLSCMAKGENESKLRTACALMSNGDSNCALTWSQLHRVILAYYTIVAAAKAILVKAENKRAEGRRMGVLAMEAVRSCFHAVGAEEQGTVTVDDVVDWYNENHEMWLPFLSVVLGGDKKANDKHVAAATADTASKQPESIGQEVSKEIDDQPKASSVDGSNEEKSESQLGSESVQENAKEEAVLVDAEGETKDIADETNEISANRDEDENADVISDQVESEERNKQETETSQVDTRSKKSNDSEPNPGDGDDTAPSAKS